MKIATACARFVTAIFLAEYTILEKNLFQRKTECFYYDFYANNGV